MKANSLSFQGIEVSPVFIGVFKTKLKIISLPPRSGYVDIAFRTGDDEFPFGLYAAPHLDRGGCILKEKVNFCEAVVFQRLIFK